MIIKLNRCYKFFLLASLFVFMSAVMIYAVEFDTSTGEEDIVFMSTDGEVNLGDSLSKSVEKRFKLIEDEALQKRINDIGQKLASLCDRRDIIYHFKLIEDKEKERPMINAFSLPGGYVYMFKDLYDKLEGDDELAAVIAHEIAHIVARHGVKRMQSTFGYNILMVLASQTQTDRGNMGRAFAAINSLMSSYSREDEVFADKLSVKYTKKAGYNPEGVVKVLQKLWDIQREEPQRRYVEDRSHPYLSIRVSKAKQEIYGKMDFNDYINIPAETRK